MAKPNSYEPKVTLEIALDHGLTEEEFGFIKEKLGRIPTFTEMGYTR